MTRLLIGFLLGWYVGASSGGTPKSTVVADEALERSMVLGRPLTRADLERMKYSRRRG